MGPFLFAWATLAPVPVAVGAEENAECVTGSDVVDGPSPETGARTSCVVLLIRRRFRVCRPPWGESTGRLELLAPPVVLLDDAGAGALLDKICGSNSDA